MTYLPTPEDPYGGNFLMAWAVILAAFFLGFLFGALLL